MREHEAASTLRSFYFRKGDRIFSQVAFNQNAAQSKTIGGGKMHGTSDQFGEAAFCKTSGREDCICISLGKSWIWSLQRSFQTFRGTFWAWLFSPQRRCNRLITLKWFLPDRLLLFFTDQDWDFFFLLLLYFSTEVCIRVCILSVVCVVGQAGFICFVEFVLFCIFGGKHERKASIRLDLLNYSPGFTPLWRCSLNWCFPGKLEQKARREQFPLFHAAFSDFPWWTEETP